ncbi:MAG: NAD kinase [Crocinitomicaceae bacterium]|nr:NAD kinase [Crocinitomicaceae bacterium]MDG1776578.1 NAD kinase [Crocinitomicaceae bacterium]
MNVSIYGRKVNKQNIGSYLELIKLLNDFGWNPVIHSELKQLLLKKSVLSESIDEFSNHNDLKSGIDLSLSIGGDGTFIQNVKFIRDSGVPVLGINTGRLGFLSTISKDDLAEAMDLVKDKKYVHQERSLIRVETERDIFGDDNFALNEVTLQKKDSSSMITVHASLDNKYLNSYWADGLIVSTPSGSTAYSLSCGGPIITPGCQVHILTPIAPHNLNVRPIVAPDHMPIKLNIEGRNRSYLISLDGNSHSIKQNEEVIIHKANYMVNVIKFEENNFLDTIRNKMLWGKDKRN